MKIRNRLAPVVSNDEIREIVRNAARRVEAAANARLIAEAPELFRTVVKLSKELRAANSRLLDVADKLDLLEEEAPRYDRRVVLIAAANALVADITTSP